LAIVLFVHFRLTDFDYPFLLSIYIHYLSVVLIDDIFQLYIVISGK
jgi:hypothetical protein